MPYTTQHVVQCIRNNNILTFRGIAKANKYDFKSLLQAPHIPSELALHATSRTLQFFSKYMTFYTHDMGCMLPMAGRPKLLSKLQLVTHETYNVPLNELSLVKEVTNLVHYILTTFKSNTKTFRDKNFKTVLEAYPQMVHNMEIQENRSIVILHKEYYQKYRKYKILTFNILYTWAILHDVQIYYHCGENKRMVFGSDLCKMCQRNDGVKIPVYTEIYNNILRFVIAQRLITDTWMHLYNKIREKYKGSMLFESNDSMILKFIRTAISLGYISIIYKTLSEDTTYCVYHITSLMQLYCQSHNKTYIVPIAKEQDTKFLMYIVNKSTNIVKTMDTGYNILQFMATLGQPDLLSIVDTRVQSTNQTRPK